MKTVTSLQICISIIFVISLMGCCTRGSGAGVPVLGGLSEDIKKADAEVQSMVDQFKPEIEQKTNTKFQSLEAVSYKTQVVAGLNYFVKVKAVTDASVQEILHLRIYKHFRNAPELSAVLRGQNLQSPIEHFQ